MKASKQMIAGVMVALVIIAVIILRISSGKNTSNQNASAYDALVNAALGKEDIQLRISKEQMTSIFQESGGTDYVVIDIYPVKHPKKENIELQVVFSTPGGGHILGKHISEQAFKAQAKNYLDELKKDNYPYTPPHGYQILAMEKKFGTKNNLVIDFNKKDLGVHYMYDSCRFPPGCYPAKMEAQAAKTEGQDDDEDDEPSQVVHTAYVLTRSHIFQDSCRFPPGCPQSLFFGKVMDTLLSEKVKMKKMKK